MQTALFFDLDGTLIDSREDIADSLNLALSYEGFEPLPLAKIEEMVGWGARQLVKEALGAVSDETIARVFVKFCEHYNEHLLDKTRLYPGVEAFLEARKDHYKAVVTNKPAYFSNRILAGLKIDQHFQRVIAGDTLPVQKPDPKVFAPIFEDLAGSFQGLMIGDSAVDVECGRAAGFLTCAVTYGFRPREELEAARPDFLIDRFEELLNLSVTN